MEDGDVLVSDVEVYLHGILYGCHLLLDQWRFASLVQGNPSR